MKTLKSDETQITNDLFHDKERHSPVTPTVVLKGSVFTLPVIKLSSFDMKQIRQGLEEHLSSALEFFRHAPMVVDLSETHNAQHNTNFSELADVLKTFELVCVAVQNGSQAQHEAAIENGLAVLSGQLKIHPKYPQKPGPHVAEKGTDADKQRKEDAVNDMKTDVVVAETTKVINTPIRSGQRVYAKGGDLILLAAVNAGAEIMADGNIHIYAPLRGRALAGVNGNTSARIFCHSLEAELVAIAGSYRVFEDVIPDDIHKKSVQIFLEGEQLIIKDID